MKETVTTASLGLNEDLESRNNLRNTQYAQDNALPHVAKYSRNVREHGRGVQDEQGELHLS